MKRTSLITDFVCYLVIFVFVFSAGAYIIGKEIKYNRELLEIDNARNKEASKYAKDFASKQKEILELTSKKYELENSLNQLVTLTAVKENDANAQDSEIAALQAEITSLTSSITSYSEELSTLSSKIKDLNATYLQKNDTYIQILKQEINN